MEMLQPVPCRTQPAGSTVRGAPDHIHGIFEFEPMDLMAFSVFDVDTVRQLYPPLQGVVTDHSPRFIQSDGFNSFQ